MKLGIKIMLVLVVACSTQLSAISYKFNFIENKAKKGFNTVQHDRVYSDKNAYGYDLNSSFNGKDAFYFSVKLPEGNYKVKIVLGNQSVEALTTVKAETRRLMLANIATKPAEFVTREFVVNVRTPLISGHDSVRIKERERKKLDWDNKLTFEINGKNPSIATLEITPIQVPTIFLAGNSTVVDQDNEPWCGWGQILPYYLSPKIAVANYAESGEAGNSFIRSKRFGKLFSVMKKGDYLFIEFGHNDQKQTGENAGPYKSYKKSLEYMIQETQKKGGIPVLVTPMNRRRFDDSAHVVNTLGEYPDAVRKTANEQGIMYVDLNKMSKIMYEAWGPDRSIKAFVHYPMGTFAGQTRELADNTHFNTFGGTEICKCILRGLCDNKSPLVQYINDNYGAFDPAHPDDFSMFNIPVSPFCSMVKPDGD